MDSGEVGFYHQNILYNLQGSDHKLNINYHINHMFNLVLYIIQEYMDNLVVTNL
jgi:hypothetical protein